MLFCSQAIACKIVIFKTGDSLVSLGLDRHFHFTCPFLLIGRIFLLVLEISVANGVNHKGIPS